MIKFKIFGYFKSLSLFVFIAFVSIQASYADALLSGSWQGQVSESEIGSYVVAVTISPDGRSGSVEYRQYPCGGSLNRISGSGAQATYSEQLNFGVEKCMAGLTVRLTYQGPNTIYFEEILDGQAGVYGALNQVGGPVGASCGEAGIGLATDLGTCFSTSQGKTVCVQESMQKYENSIAHHSDSCGFTCGAILHGCIVNMGSYNPDGAYGCVTGMVGNSCATDD
ncbi:MAG: hypothetical protein HOM55_04945 [Proteobacteria bacterium]|jgi:hypothetical protein|nr:hypothetical protein [Pseudomonadota bacterium]